MPKRKKKSSVTATDFARMAEMLRLMMKLFGIRKLELTEDDRLDITF